MKIFDDEKMYSIVSICDKLNVSKSTVDKWLYKGILPNCDFLQYYQKSHKQAGRKIIRWKGTTLNLFCDRQNPKL